MLRTREQRQSGGVFDGGNVEVSGKNLAEGQEQDDGRSELEEQVKGVEERFHGQNDIPVPEFWGGLRVVPDMVEFWQGRDSRLHDRLRYEKVDHGKGDAQEEWRIERLSP